MRGIAEYVMTGRRQAIIVVLLCGFFPMLYFVSAGVVGLVNLRKGLHEGLIILLWSLLPAGLLGALSGDVSPALLMLSVAGLSQLLRITDSWPKVLMLSTVLGVIIQISLNWQPVYVENLRIVSETFTPLLNQDSPVQYTVAEILELMLSFYGAYQMLVMILCLMLARWWQATLYNPGGFQQEFHLLRLDPRFMMLMVGLILAGIMAIAPLDRWLTIFCIAPIFGGIALIHSIVAQKKMGPFWLVLCYLTLFMMPPVFILLGLLDSVFDFRKRILS